MKRNAKIMGRIAATAMAVAMTVTAIPVNAAEMPAPSDEQKKTVESEKGVELTEEGDETLEPESGIKDTVAPTLTGLTVSATKVTAPGTIELVADATDDISGVSSIQVNLSTDTPAPSDEYHSYDSIGFSTTYFDEKLRQTVKYADGKWHGTFDTSYMNPGAYKISEIYVYDKAGNRSIYSEFWNQIPDNIKNISIQVDKGNMQLPAVSNVSFEKTTIQPSEKVKVTVQLTGDTSGFERVRLVFSPEKMWHLVLALH